MTKKSCFLAVFLLTLFVIMLKYPYVCLPLRGQQANINRQQAPDIAENRTFSSSTKLRQQPFWCGARQKASFVNIETKCKSGLPWTEPFSHLTKLTILTKLTNEPSQPSRIQNRVSSIEYQESRIKHRESNFSSL